MTAVSGASLRTTEAYWELSGPLPAVRLVNCRACKKPAYKGNLVYVRDGRKLRFFYHEECFTGDADPRTQENGAYQTKKEYHTKTAPLLSSLEGPRACRDNDGRVLGREVFKPEAPKELGAGKWSVNSRGYQPSASALSTTTTTTTSSSKLLSSKVSSRNSSPKKKS